MNEDVEREEIEKLLPWYVMGRLDRVEASKVEGYLGRHPNMMAQLDLIRDERQETVRANEETELPPSTMVGRLMAALPARHGPRFDLWLSGVVRFFTMPTARGAQWAALIAAVLVVAQAGVIATLLMRSGDQSYQAASGPPTARVLSVLVVFADDAKAPAIARFLTEFDANIVDGPKPGGVYRLRLRALDTSQAAQDELLKRLAERRDVVRILLPSRD
jgi:hypothetical protein